MVLRYTTADENTLAPAASVMRPVLPRQRQVTDLPGT